MSKRIEVPPGKKLIFRPWRVNPKTGEREYPRRGKVFPMLVDIEPANGDVESVANEDREVPVKPARKKKA